MLPVNKILCGDCLSVMKDIPNNVIDSIITDPPYGIHFMGKTWDKFGGAVGVSHLTTNERHGCMHAGSYDYSKNSEFQQIMFKWATKVLRIAKPGAIMLIFGGTRTYHRLACAIEDAGWQIRDCMMWIYGSGFPKSASISQQFDKVACREQLEKELGRKPTKKDLKKAWESFRKVIGDKPYTSPDIRCGNLMNSQGKERLQRHETTPATDLAKLWDGYGTALKPAWEPIIVAMKPLDGTFAQNAEKWGVAGLNINGGRIGTDIINVHHFKGEHSFDKGRGIKPYTDHQGRWPANLLLDEDAAAMLDEQSGESKSTDRIRHNNQSKFSGKGIYGKFQDKNTGGFADSGGASRFFYCAKASRAERNAGLKGMPEKRPDTRTDIGKGIWVEKGTAKQTNPHPTVKPLALMEYLCNLTKTPAGGIVLDPFAGSGSTLIACVNTGRNFIGIEKEAEYCAIAKKRLARAREKFGLYEKGKEMVKL